MDYRVYAKSVKSASVQHKDNEDSCMYTEISFMKDNPIRIFVIADGMGGLEDGRRASRNAVRGFMRSIYTDIMECYMDTEMDEFSMKYAVEDIKSALRTAVNAANTSVCDGAESCQPTGSTISAICVVGDYAVIANVGDSPVYFYRKQERKLRLVSRLQTKAEQDVEAGAYERNSSQYLRNEHILYCSLGQYDRLQEEDIYVTAIGSLRAGDAFLAGSDGCFGYINEKVLGDMLNECSTEEESFLLEQIFSLARMDKDDDQTAFLCITA